MKGEKEVFTPSAFIPHPSSFNIRLIDRRYLDGLEKSGFFDKPRTGSSPSRLDPACAARV